MKTLFCRTLRTSGAKLAKAVLGVSVDQLTGNREPNSIWHVLYSLHWGWSSGLPQQKVIVYPKIFRIWIRIIKCIEKNMQLKKFSPDMTVAGEPQVQ